MTDDVTTTLAERLRAHEDEPRGPLVGGTARWIPRHYWWRVFIGRVRHPGHKWMYSGIVRRDTFTVLGWGLIVMRMPRRTPR